MPYRKVSYQSQKLWHFVMLKAFWSKFMVENLAIEVRRDWTNCLRAPANCSSILKLAYVTLWRNIIAWAFIFSVYIHIKVCFFYKGWWNCLTNNGFTLNIHYQPFLMFRTLWSLRNNLMGLHYRNWINTTKSFYRYNIELLLNLVKG